MTEAIRQGDIPGVQLRCRRMLAVDAQAAWRWVTDSKSQERWLCPRVVLAGEEEGQFAWHGNAEFGEETVEACETLLQRAPRGWLLALRQPHWPAATRLEFELTAYGDATELSVLQNGFEHLPLSISLTVWEAYRRHWRAALERLAAVTG